MNHYVFMTVLVTLQIGYRKALMLQQLPRSRLTTHAKAFGREPNALPNSVIA